MYCSLRCKEKHLETVQRNPVNPVTNRQLKSGCINGVAVAFRDSLNTCPDFPFVASVLVEPFFKSVSVKAIKSLSFSTWQ